MNKKIIYTTLAVSGIIFVMLFLIHALRISYPISVTTSNTSTELSVIGEGKVDVIPDTANISLGVTVSNKASVEEVQKTLDETNNKIVDAISKLGVQKEDIKTQDYSIYPNYVYENNQNRLDGYNGSVTINVKVKKTELASKVIGEATKAGANQVMGTHFSVDNPEKYREQAREKAIANAKEQAQKLAKNLGIRLGKVSNIIESTGYGGGPVPMFDKAMMRSEGLGGDTAELQPGSQTITSVVTLYFEKN